MPTPTAQKASLFATIGPSGCRGIALSGHTDVVPVTARRGTADPFTLVERDGRLYGRGSCDMKGYLACVLALPCRIPQARSSQVPIHIAFSYDEEVGCTGVRPMIAELGKPPRRCRAWCSSASRPHERGRRPQGPVRWRVEVKGRAAHSSMPHLGVNAITYAGRLLRELARIEAGAEGRRADPRFDPPYTTLQVTADRRRHRLQHRAGAVLVRLGDPRLARLRRRRRSTGASAPFAANECLPEMRARGAGGGHRDRASPTQVPAFAAETDSEVVRAGA